MKILEKTRKATKMTRFDRYRSGRWFFVPVVLKNTGTPELPCFPYVFLLAVPLFRYNKNLELDMI
jgi:hypothetical protein